MPTEYQSHVIEACVMKLYSFQSRQGKYRSTFILLAIVLDTFVNVVTSTRE